MAPFAALRVTEPPLPDQPLSIDRSSLIHGRSPLYLWFSNPSPACFGCAGPCPGPVSSSFLRSRRSSACESGPLSYWLWRFRSDSWLRSRPKELNGAQVHRPRVERERRRDGVRFPELSRLGRIPGGAVPAGRRALPRPSLPGPQQHRDRIRTGRLPHPELALEDRRRARRTGQPPGGLARMRSRAWRTATSSRPRA